MALGYMTNKTELLSAADARALDQIAAAQGVSEASLIKNAGRRAAQIIARLYSPCRVHLLCGAGNNGADGLVAAHNLQQMGFDCRVFMLADNPHRNFWRGKRYDLADNPACHNKADLIIDALFGSGLARALPQNLLELARAIKPPVVALDMPSGFSCDDGSDYNASGGFRADHTISFVRAHPGHYLLPAKTHCGTIHIADIGIDNLLPQIAPKIKLNHYAPPPPPDARAHKYQRGVVVVVAGDFHKRGAASLAASAAMRIGAGLVVVNQPDPSAQTQIDIMTETCSLAQSLDDERRRVVVLGCGNGVSARTKQNVLLALSKNIDCVLDADALSCFQNDSATLFAAIKSKPSGAVVLTPHDGEFARLFELEGAKITRARAAAELSGAIVVAKGNDSVIAAPSGEVIINDSAPPHLAKGGTGDVLAGLIGGMLAQRQRASLEGRVLEGRVLEGRSLDAPLDLVAAAVYIHGLLGHAAGAHLLASDLPNLLPTIIKEINDS